MNLINSITYKTLLYCAIILFYGCSTQPTKTDSVSDFPAEKVKSLDNQLEKIFNNEELNIKKAKKLQGEYQSLLSISPEYSPAQVSLYRLSLEIEVAEFDIDNEKKIIDSQRQLIRMYLKMPKALRRELLPPTMVLYQAKFPDYVLSSNIWLSSQYYIATGKMPRKVTKDDLYELILLSAKASPENFMVRAMAAEHAFDTGHPSFGISALKEVMVESPNSALAPAMLAEYYFKEAWDSACPNEHKESLKESLAYYKITLERNPEASLKIRNNTSLIYALLGLKPLALNEAKILAESNDFASLWRAAYVYVYYKKIDLAQAAFDKAGKIENFISKPRGRGYVDFLMASGRWNEAAEAYKSYLANRGAITSWDTLYAALIAKKLKSMGQDVEYADIRRASSKRKTGKYDWPETLNKILHGEDESPKITNTCDQLRLDFYKGASAVLNQGDYDAGQKAAEAISGSEMNFFLEAQIFEEVLLKK